MANDVLLIDTETTGKVEFEKSADWSGQPRCCALGIQFRHGDTGLCVRSWEGLIRPDRWSIDRGDTGIIHGITDEMCITYGVPMQEVLEDVLNTVVNWPRPLELVNANPYFDVKVLRIEGHHYGMQRRVEDVLKPLPTICVLKKSQKLVGLPPTPAMLARNMRGPKQPSLAEAYLHFFGEAHIEHHSAGADCGAASRVYFHLKNTGALDGTAKAAVPAAHQKPTGPLPPANTPPPAAGPDLDIDFTV